MICIEIDKSLTELERQFSLSETDEQNGAAHTNRSGRTFHATNRSTNSKVSAIASCQLYSIRNWATVQLSNGATEQRDTELAASTAKLKLIVGERRLEDCDWGLLYYYYYIGGFRSSEAAAESSVFRLRFLCQSSSCARSLGCKSLHGSSGL